MRKNSTREMVIAGFFITMGIIIPAILHPFNIGKSFLPMHVPVILAGFLLGLPYAVAVGVITPLLSSFITGMPPMFPVLPFMVFELGVYAGAANLLSRKIKLNTYLSLIVSMVAGRIAAGIVVWVMVVIFGAKLPGPAAFVISAVTTGIPGIAIQLVFIPPMVILLKKQILSEMRSV